MIIAVKHTINAPADKVLEGSNMITRMGEGYGDVFFPSELLSSNLPTLYKVIRKVEARFDKAKKTYIE